MTTLGERLASRDNGLDVIRLVLAASVIISHTWLVGGFGDHITIRLGGWAVNGFFVISGYLIAASGSRLPLGAYLWRRALRLLPAFWVVLIVTAFVLAPLAASVAGDTFMPGSAFGYVLHNAGLNIGQWGIAQTLESVPYAGVWNASLWTLIYEAIAYLFIAALFLIPWARKYPFAFILPIFVVTNLAWPLLEGPIDANISVSQSGLRLFSFFAAGMLVFAIRDRIKVHSWAGPVALAVFLALLLLETGRYWAPLPMAIALLWLGVVLPLRTWRGMDLSYGVYVWAFPVQQLIVVFGLAWVGPWGTAAAAFVITLGLAWISWTLVEKPALELRRLVPARRGAKSQPTESPRGLGSK